LSALTLNPSPKGRGTWNGSLAPLLPRGKLSLTPPFEGGCEEDLNLAAKARKQTLALYITGEDTAHSKVFEESLQSVLRENPSKLDGANR
jgi:hypothetical protein